MAVSSVWDLVNTPDTPYASAAPILIRHLEVATDERLVEGIARALTNKAFRAAMPALIQQFRAVTNDAARWAIGNAIAAVAWKGHENAILELAANPAFGSGRQMLVWRLHRIKDRSVEPLLISLLGDPTVDAFAASALGYCGGRNALDALQSMNFSDRTLHTKKAVPKAIAKIEERSAR